MIQYIIGAVSEIELSDAESPAAPHEPGFGDYFAAEGLLVDFVAGCAAHLGGSPATVTAPRLDIPLPDWLGEFRNGSVLSTGQVRRLFTATLRGVKIGCTLAPGEGGELLVGCGFDGTVQIDSARERGSEIRGLLPEGLEIITVQESDRPELRSTPADDAFWSEVGRLLEDRSGPLLVIERWAYGLWGETWRTADGASIAGVRESIRENSLVMVYDLPDFEEITLAERFDRTSVLAVDDLDLRYFRSAASGPDLRIKPLTSATALADDEDWATPIRLVSSGFTGRTPLLAGVVPEKASGAVTARWLAW